MAAGDGSAFFREPVVRIQGFVVRRWATFTAGLGIMAHEVLIMHSARPMLLCVSMGLVAMPTLTQDERPGGFCVPRASKHPLAPRRLAGEA